MSMSKKINRRLGKIQAQLLDHLDHRKSWSRKCSWVWSTENGTLRMLERLLTRGYVWHDADGKWYITFEGRQALKAHKYDQNKKAG